MAYPTDPVVLAGIWTMTILVMLFFSYTLYKESWLFRVSEHFFTATALAVLTVTMFETIISSCINPLIGGRYEYIILVILGLLMYTRLSKERAWISRWPFALVIGAGIGISFRRVLTDLMVNIKRVSLFGSDFAADPPLSYINVSILMIGIVSVVAYFIFRPRRERSVLDYMYRIGRWYLVLGWAASYGNVAIRRFGLLIDRVEAIMKVVGLLPY